jgi:hypothetical protein
MNRTLARHRLTAALATALAAGVACPALGSDLDALDLQVQAPQQAATQDSGSRWFVEGSVGRADQRYGLGSRSIGRVAVDGRHMQPLGAQMRAVVSARLDASRPQDASIDNPVFSLREAYLGWQGDAGALAWELGRVNLREGPGYGYNPTDFLRDHALRTISTQNPFTLRENRLGSVMLRGQRSWAGGSLSAVYAPRLDSGPSDESWSADLGATNARHRALVTLSTRWSETLDSRLVVFKEDGAPLRMGASATALVSDTAVAHAEWSYGREPSLHARALGLPDDERGRHRAVAGLTVTTPTRLSLTAEAQYNGFALDRDGWRALQAAGVPALATYYGTAVARQDNAARQAVLLYAVQRDLGLRNLDLTALARLNLTDRSRLLWLDLRYRMDRAELALQWQGSGGPRGAEYTVAPIRRSIALLLVGYF